MRRTNKLAISTLALAITIGGGAWLTQLSYAEETGTAPTPALTQPGSGDQAQTPEAAPSDSRKGKRGGQGHHGKAMFKSDELAQLLGMTQDELREQLRAGKTLAEIAKEKGVDSQKVIDLLVKGMTERLDQKLAEGTITKEQYEAHKVKLAEHVKMFVNGELKAKQGMGIFWGQSEQIAKVLGLTADELKAQVGSGKTLAAIAKEKGVDVQKVTDVLVQGMTARLDQRLKDGAMTQEQYNQQKSQLADRAAKIVNGEWTHKGKEGKAGDKRGSKGKKVQVQQASEA